MHNTGNPLPSKDILDLYDNSEVVDNFVNSQQDETPDRFGQKRLTLAGLIKRSMALRNEINDFSGALTFRPEWSDIPMNVSEGVGGEGGALNLQAEALGNRTEINKITSREALRRTYQEAGYNLVEGSFEQGAVITSTTDVVLHEKTGKCYSGPIGNVPKGTDPLSEEFEPIDNSSLRTELELEVIKFVTPEMFVNISSDLTAAIQMAVDNGLNIDMSGRDWTINRTIIIRDGVTINLESSNIIANTGTAPIFAYNDTTGRGVTIKQGGGIITGTAGAFLSCTGKSNTPVNSDYVKMIRLKGIHVSSPSIEIGLHFVNAVRQIFIDKCMFYTKNGIVANGKIVEMMVAKTIIYGSSPGTGTVGVQAISSGAGNYYNEGWHFTDCTIDNFEKTFDIRDIFVFTINGGFVGCNSPTGYAMSFGGKTTTHCRELTINTVIGGKVLFISEPTGWFVNAKFNGIITRINQGVAFRIAGNASGIDINMTFNTLTNAGCVLVGNNCSNVNVDGQTDSSPIFGVQFTGTNGSGCGIGGFKYRGSGQGLYAQRPVYRKGFLSPLPEDLSYSQVSDLALPGSFSVGSVITTGKLTVAKGERGFITFSVAYAGGNDEQILQVRVPNGISVYTEPGQSPLNTTVYLSTGLISKTIPFHATDDVLSGVFTLVNFAGNTLSIGSHSYMSVILN